MRSAYLSLIWLCVSATMPAAVRAVTVLDWPLDWNAPSRPQAAVCVQAEDASLRVQDFRWRSRSDDSGRWVFRTDRDSAASDFAWSETVGRLLTATNDFTLEGWCLLGELPPPGGERTLVSADPTSDYRWFVALRRGRTGSACSWWLYMSSPSPRFVSFGEAEDAGALTNAWRHWALSYDFCADAAGCTWRFYLDGRLVGSRRDVSPAAGPKDTGRPVFPLGRFGLGGQGRPATLFEGSFARCRLTTAVLGPGRFLRDEAGPPAAASWERMPDDAVADDSDAGRTLCNGIVLPKTWPPRIDPEGRVPVSAPYLEPGSVPPVIPIDIGRQLFVDDFLVAETSGLVRVFYKPVKHEANPLLWPETPIERAQDTALENCPYPKSGMRHTPGCVMPGGGVWWDPTIGRFRLWYLSGWWGRLCYAESADAIHWERPAVGPNGDNVLLPGTFFDTFSVWPDYTAENPYGRWRMSDSPGGNPTRSFLFTSADGIRWDLRRLTGRHDDSTTMFYNPFLGKWIWSLRANRRTPGGERRRTRVYHAHRDFLAGGDWTFPDGGRTNTEDCAFWLACDSADLPREIDGSVRTNCQMYNVDAVPYESIMLGLFKILCGRDNEEAGKGALPKTTAVHFAYSRDGFHFTRPDRTPAIPDSGWGSGRWDTGYVGPCSSGCVIKDERLWFFYTGLRGDAGAKTAEPGGGSACNGMYWNGAIGAATLRRDGFAGLVADGRGSLTTRPVVFSGAHFFVNADARFGEIAVEVVDEDGNPHPGYAAADCRGLVRVDSTKRAVTWSGGDLSRFAGRPVRFRFDMRVATLFSFWVSRRPTGESGGYVAAGGPAYRGLRDE